MSTLTPELRDRLRQELPGWLREDPEFSRWILNLARGEFAGRQETESRFDRVLDEMRRDRETQERKWAEQIAENHRLHAEVMAMAAAGKPRVAGKT